MFWRGVFGYLPVQALQALVGFGGVYVFTRLLSPEQYGQYALALSSAALLHAGLMSWLEAAMERFHIGQVERGEAASHLATLYLAFAVVAGLGLLLTALALLVVPAEPSLKTAIVGAVAAATVRSALRLVQQRRKAEGHVRIYALSDMACTGGGFALGVLLASAGQGAVAPFLGAGGAAALLLLIVLPQEIGRSAAGRFQAQRLKRYAAYGLPISAALLLAVVYSSTNRFMIANFIDHASVGAYHAAQGLTSRALDVVFVWLGLAGAPSLIAALERGGREQMRAAARVQFEVMALVAIPAAVGLSLVSRPLAELMIGEALRPAAVSIIPWLTVTAVLAGFKAYYFDQAFTLAGRPGFMIWSSAATAGLNLLLGLMLLPRLGLPGVVAATAFSMAAGLGVSYGWGLRIMPLPVPWSTLWRCGAAAAGMALILLQLPDAGGLPELLLKTGAGILAYGVLVILTDAAGARRRAFGLLSSRS